MNTKRILSLVLCLILALALFAGCSGGGSEATEAPTATEAPASEPDATEAPAEGGEATEAPAEPGEISLPLVDEYTEFELFTGMMPPAMDYIDSMEECYVFQQLEERTGIHMVITQVHPSSQAELFNIMVTSGDYADFINSVASLYSGGLPAAVDQEVVLDLTDLVNEYAPNYLALINSNDNVYRDVTLDDGSIGCFYNIFTQEEYSDAGPMIRGDWLEELDMERPQTYDQYHEVLQAFKTEYNATMWIPATGVCNTLMYGFDMMGGYTTGMQTQLLCYYVVDGEVKCGWLEDGFREYVTLMSDWYAEGLIDPDYISGDTSSTTVNNQTDALGALLNNEYGVWADDILAMDTYDLQVADFPAVAAYHATKNEGDMLHVGYYTSYVNSPSWSISTTCEDPELATRYVDYLYSADGSLLCNWGTEGYTYTVNADGSYSFTDLITNNPEGMPYNVAQFVYLMDSGPFNLNRDRMRTTFDDAQLECYDVWQSNYDRAWTMSSFLSLNTEESDEYGTLMGDILTYVSEALNQFIVGELSVESDYDNFVETLRDLGIEDCVQFYQNAYDRWASK